MPAGQRVLVQRDVASAAAWFDDLVVEVLPRRTSPPARRREPVVLIVRACEVPTLDEVLDRLNRDGIASALHDQVLQLEARLLRTVRHEAAARKLVGLE